jgi:hypothetical protein
VAIFLGLDRWTLCCCNLQANAMANLRRHHTNDVITISARKWWFLRIVLVFVSFQRLQRNKTGRFRRFYLYILNLKVVPTLKHIHEHFIIEDVSFSRSMMFFTLRPYKKFVPPNSSANTFYWTGNMTVPAKMICLSIRKKNIMILGSLVNILLGLKLLGPILP